jgi:hypothetical protein|tara:strand:+ start:123 stop:380 length:258 start_codon:yes stop_codon:yes gene_type:complete
MSDDKLNESDKFFVVKRTAWNFKNSYDYDIVKSNAYSLTKAIKIILASEQLNDNEDVTYHLQPAKFEVVEKPLVLENEVSEVMPF